LNPNDFPAAGHLAALPLFPLHAVLFPGGCLPLKVFEARYIDLVSQCLRDQRGFGIVCLRQGSEVRGAQQSVRFETVGVLASIHSVDADEPGLLRVLVQGGRRFNFGRSQQTANGLWLAEDAQLLPDDPALPLAPRHQAAAASLGRTLLGLLRKDPSYLHGGQARLNDTAWVANRWCELLPIPLAARQQLMALEDPSARLDLVDHFLRDKQLIS
jgi:Lon protease-like protein